MGTLIARPRAVARRRWRTARLERAHPELADRRRSQRRFVDSLARSYGPEWAQFHGAHATFRERATVVGAVTPAVTVACVSNRPAFLGNVVDNVENQLGVDVELVIIATMSDLDPSPLTDAVGSGAVPTRVEHLPGVTIGAGLNRAVVLAGGRYIAKFDDDDLYGPRYLQDQVLALRIGDAGVVGKHSYFAYLDASRRLVLRFPGHEYEMTGFVAGGTLTIDRDRVRQPQFADRSLGEDTEFLARCHRAGTPVLAGDVFNYVQIRGTHNTWQPGDARYMSKASIIGDELDCSLLMI